MFGYKKSDDGAILIHSLENLSVLCFIDKNVIKIELVKPPPIELSRNERRNKISSKG